MEKSLDFDYTFKYILIGDASVGKSTILNMFINGQFAQDSNPTMGVQFATKKIQVGNSIIKIQIWDTVTIVIVRLGNNLFVQLQELTIKMLSELYQSMIFMTRRLLKRSILGLRKSMIILMNKLKSFLSEIKLTLLRVLLLLLPDLNFLFSLLLLKQERISISSSLL